MRPWKKVSEEDDLEKSPHPKISELFSWMVNNTEKASSRKEKVPIWNTLLPPTFAYSATIEAFSMSMIFSLGIPRKIRIELLDYLEFSICDRVTIFSKFPFEKLIFHSQLSMDNPRSW